MVACGAVPEPSGVITTSCLQCGTPAARPDATFCRRCGLPYGDAPRADAELPSCPGPRTEEASHAFDEILERELGRTRA